MKILVVDSVHAACITLARGITANLRFEALCASSTMEALARLEMERDTISLIVLNLELGPEAGLVFLETIREFCRAAVLRTPRFLILTPGAMTDRYEERFGTFGAQCLLQGYAKQTFASIRKLVVEANRARSKVTILVNRSWPESRFLVLGSARSELIACGPRLHPLMNYFAVNFGTELSTISLAEVADIAVASVRVYLARLRARYDEARSKIGIDIPGSSVFFTERKDGSYVHMLRARVLFN